MNGVAFVDGEFVSIEDAQMSILDWGFTFSDCVYDVVSVWNRCFFKLDEHLDRFDRSCAGFRLRNPYSREEMRSILAECVERTRLDDAYVKMEITRGCTPQGSRDFRLAENRFVAYAIPYVWIWGEEKSRNGGTVHLCRRLQRVSSYAIDQRVKNYARCDLAQAKLDGYERGCDDVVLLSAEGLVTEGAGWNVLLVRDGRVFTPDWNVLEGVTRQAVSEICADEDIPFGSRSVEAAELIEADEVFGSTTAGGVLPIIAIDEVPISDGVAGPITRRLQSAYWARREAGWCGTRVGDILAGTGMGAPALGFSQR